MPAAKAKPKAKPTKKPVAKTTKPATTTPRFAVSGHQDSKIRIHDTTSWEVVRTLEGHTSDVRRLAISPNQRVLASCSDDYTVCLWDLESGKLLHQIKKQHDGYIMGLAFIDDDRLVSGCYDGTAKIWNVAAPKKPVRTVEHPDGVYRLAASRTQIATSWGFGNAVMLWDAATAKLARTLEHTGDVYCVAFSPSGRWIAGGGTDGNICIWDAASGALSKTLLHTADKTVVDVCFAGDDELWSSTDGSAIRWKLADGKQAAKLKLSGDAEAIAITADWLLEGGKDEPFGPTKGRGLQLWDARTGKKLQKFCPNESTAFAVAFGG